MPAPIALFVYNRLAHTKRTIEALEKNELAEKSELFIFSDGPRDEKDEEKIIKVREYLKEKKAFKSTYIFEQEKNLGLAKSIIKGVSEIVNSFGEIIVLEDDILTSPFFLFHMNRALDLYKDEEKVINISGYTFSYESGSLPDTFFLFFPAVWGWATWKRGWNLFDEDGERLIKQLEEKNLIKRFNFNNSFAGSIMLKNQVKGFNDSWGIRWFASSLLSEKYTLMFKESLVNNIGHDKSGIHCAESAVHDVKLLDKKLEVKKIQLVENEEALLHCEKYLRDVFFEDYNKLHDICEERLELINELNKVAQERLELINSLAKTAEERQHLIEILDKEVKRLKQ